MKQYDIAIIGVSARFVKADNKAEYWNNLRNGYNGSHPIPDDRWNQSRCFAGEKGERNKIYPEKAALLEEIHRFDNAFFDIPDEEARLMDPQQKMALELTKQLFDDAGYGKKKYYGKNISVFIGVSQSGSTEYHYSNMRLLQETQQIQKEMFQKDGEPVWHANMVPSSIVNMIPGGICHYFNLKGPAMAIDTACSSSLVALHQACHALMREESEMVICGGVNLTPTPSAMFGFAAAGALSDKGILSAFDESADGFVMGEGGGLVLLKRLEHAQKDGDRVLAVVRGSALNNDGTTMGVMAPHPVSQFNLIQRLYENCDIDAGEIDYVEAHGTATKIGDVIEFRSLQKFFEDKRDPSSVMLGSVKANIGHTLAASGIAGVIKVLGMMHDGLIYPQINFNESNKKIHYDASPFWINTDLIEKRIGLACVNSFGFGGTNAHVVLENGDTYNERVESAWLPCLPLIVGAHNEASLAEKGSRLLETVASLEKAESPERGCPDLVMSLTHLDQDCNVVLTGAVSNYDDIKEVLSDGNAVKRKPGRNLFLFTGQGSQYYKMGMDLYEYLPSFRGGMDACSALFQESMDIDLVELLYGRKNGQPPQDSLPQANDMLKRTEITQPVIFSIGYCLGKLLIEAGIKPSCMIGHSIGEWIAAALAGVVTLREAVEIVSYRGALMSRNNGKGAMVAVFSPMNASVQKIVKVCGVALSADNISHVVLGGKRENIDKALSQLAEKKIPCKELPVSSAFHTEVFANVYEDFEGFLKKFRFREPNIPIIGNVTANVVREYSGTYWAQHLICPVRFAESVEVAKKMGIKNLIECGGNKTLISMCGSTGDFSSFHFMSPGVKDGLALFTQSLSRLLPTQKKMDFASVYKGIPYNRMELPAYPFFGESTSIFPRSSNRWIKTWQWQKTRSFAQAQESVVVTWAEMKTGDTAAFDEKIRQQSETRESLDIVFLLETPDSSPSDVSMETYQRLNAVYFQNSLCFLKVLANYESLSFRVILLSELTEPQRFCGNEFSYAATLFLLSMAKQIKTVLSCSALMKKVCSWEEQDVFIENGFGKLEEGELYERILTPRKDPVALTKKSFDHGVAVLIGGMGGIGQAVCEALVRESDCCVALVGRRHMTRETDPFLARMPEGRVCYFACDITDSAEVNRVFDAIEQAYGPVNIVMNLAGNLNPRVICSLNSAPDEMAEVFKPKILGTMVLAEALKGRAMGALVLMSSVSASDALWGKGVADYAAANAFLDAFAENSTLKTVALNYTLWELEGGIDQDINSGMLSEVMRYAGLASIPAQVASKIMIQVLQGIEENSIYHIYDEEKRLPEKTIQKSQSPQEKQGGGTASKSKGKRIMKNIIGLKQEFYGLVESYIGTRIDENNEDENFMNLGMNSLAAVELINDYKEKTGVVLYPTVIFEYQTPKDLYEHIKTQYGEPDVSETEEREGAEEILAEAVSEGVPDAEGLAVVAYDIKVSGCQNDEEFWTAMLAGKVCLGDIPDDHLCVANTAQALYGGCISDVYDFDPQFFGMAPAEAKCIDPQQRKFLESSYLVLQKAGYINKKAQKNIGVYVGAEQNTYSERFANHRVFEKMAPHISDAKSLDSLRKTLYTQSTSADAVTGNSLNEIATRVSYTFGLTGPALVLNTACSSALVALSVACADLGSRRVEAALVGGVNFNLSDLPYVGLGQLGALSPDGSCRPFDNDSNGIALGEAVVSIVVKRLQDARRDGNDILGVIKDIAVNNNGFSQGVTVPTVVGQQEVIQKGQGKFPDACEKLRYIEAHGTGTPLGDPIEIASILNAVGGDLRRQCFLGSSKGNFGHPLAASGLVSLVKVLKIFEHNVVPPIAAFRKVNTRMPSLAETGLVLADEAVTISDPSYYAAINAFGFGGTNAHVLLENYRKVPDHTVMFPHVVLLSHYNSFALKQYAKRLGRYLNDSNSSVILKLVNCHAKTFAYRTMVVAGNLQELKRKLEAIGDDKETVYKKYQLKTDPEMKTESEKTSVLTCDGVSASERKRIVSYFNLDDAIVSEQLEAYLYGKAQLSGRERWAEGAGGCVIRSLEDVLEVMGRAFVAGENVDLRDVYRNVGSGHPQFTPFFPRRLIAQEASDLRRKAFSEVAYSSALNVSERADFTLTWEREMSW